MATRAVLVLCTGNTCRSQMAEGYLNTLPGVVAMSAGVKAETEVNPHAVRVMEEAGIDISKHHPKTVESMMGLPFTDIITVCDHAAETCPMFPGAAFKHHLGVADPVGYVGSAEATLDTYRKTRDELMGLIMKWNKNS
ncbi:MAG: arsenate reductase ArsC [Ignavibacteria bacterium]|nr:arsenate reductase ArsC [Ignavibacteria bacterium]